MFKLYSLLALSIMMSSAFAGVKKVEPITSYGGFTYFGSYEPEKPKSPLDIPKNIRSQLIQHLVKRLGSEFYSSLTFNGGQIVNIGELYEMEPNVKNHEWEVHSFDLHFELSKPEIGIQSYIAQIQLRQDGSIINEINLPDFSKNPEKLKIYSLSDAYNKSQESGFDTEHVNVTLAYDTKTDNLVWKFEQRTYDDGLTMVYKNIEISAHSGEIIKEYQSHGIR
ncbi:hypothetical protein [Colwellia sp. Bg11-12]|uniref:hypothetical protein n=1 Tax=Colwellia sp. Bg11-12 TaxID=2759817 RepID=UPI0015F36DAE|nr:hypothetical protein [Colwellia sp. Bg11-12]MBA6262711.1 hypothetical protein [Colwellia sp. Bg11-12]